MLQGLLREAQLPAVRPGLRTTAVQAPLPSVVSRVRQPHAPHRATRRAVVTTAVALRAAEAAASARAALPAAVAVVPYVLQAVAVVAADANQSGHTAPLLQTGINKIK